MADHDRLPIGETLRAHRLRANLSQTDLASKMSVYYGIIARVERGEQAPTRDQLDSFITALRLGPEESGELRQTYELEPPARQAPGHPQFDRHVCPYRGLHAFLERDAEFYCGRDTASDLLAAKVSVSSVVAVVGASGSGKSSLVQAGLVPRLRRDKGFGDLQTAVFRPGPDPFTALAAQLIEVPGLRLRARTASALVREVAELARTLRHNGIQAVVDQVQRMSSRPLVLVVDQFEEVFTHRGDPALSDDFLAGLAALGDQPWDGSAPTKLVLTLRSDYYGHALAHRALSDLLQDNVVHLPPMNRDELRTAVTEPARRGHITLQQGLLDRIMDDVGSDRGNLPLLEYALMLVWERQRDRVMTLDAYDEIGGVRGAVASQAEQVYSVLAPEQQNTARRLLTSLVRVVPPGEDGADTRRRTPRAELSSLPRVDRVLEALTSARLVVGDADEEGAPQVELAHEAVITAWRRLGVWLEDDRQFLLWQQGLRQRRQEWLEHRRDDAALLRGTILERAESWLGTRGADALAADLIDYIEASRAADRDEQEHRAALHIDALRTARADKVPGIIDELRRLSPGADAQLARELAEWDGSPDVWRLRLARLPADPGQLPAILRALLTLAPGEFRAVRELLPGLLGGEVRDLVERLWREVTTPDLDPTGTGSARFRSAALLAEYAPRDPRWDQIASTVAQTLALENPVYRQDWLAAFAPVVDRLVEPLVSLACDGTLEHARESAARILLEVAGDRADVVGRIVCDLPDQMYEWAFNSLAAALRDRPAEDGPAAGDGWSALDATLAGMAPVGASEDEEVAAGRRRAAAACALLRLGRPEGVLERFDHVDVETASQFASTAAQRNVPFRLLVDRLAQAATAQIRWIVLLALGEYHPRKFLSAAEFDDLMAVVSRIHRDDPSAAVHSVCGWLARRWDAPCDPLAAQRPYDPSGRCGWFTLAVEDQVLTFSVLRPGAFAMGSPLSERDRSEWESPVRHTELAKSFAVCTAEVTRGLYEAFAAQSGARPPAPDEWPPHPAEPIVGVTWFEARTMCGWLGEQLQIPDRAGFGLRLPNEAEWEYACRAGTTTPYSFGRDRSLLTNYAWVSRNSQLRTHEAGILRPNPAGLFNMHGQCWEWCLDWFTPYGVEPRADPADSGWDAETADQQFKALRGGSWMQNGGYARSACRHLLPPGNRNSNVSFRLACTVPEPDGSGAATLPWTG